ncbi:alkane hydroxylase MAH1-like [Malania oleifera]|uniref:alkane hydroxylase MAH1-like n=1 Tax=Malania oleifera TaxID=397392 RepID=UPI0025AE29C0|nr:alkane hydroxylase MAH1-like [Malania oleifera]
MALSIASTEIFLPLLLCFLFLLRRRHQHKNSLITNWPLLGMTPGLLRNAHRIHDYLTELIIHGGGTTEVKGPLFIGMDALITSDPTNVQHILNKSFPNFPKGDDHKAIFDILGDGILNSDCDSWKSQRKITHPLIKRVGYRRFVERTARLKVENGLLPVLDDVTEQGMEIDMQDLFKRFTFDVVCVVILGFDPCYLSIGFPQVPSAKVFGEIEEALLYRHILPEGCWKLQRKLGIGKEKTITEGRRIIDQFLAQCIELNLGKRGGQPQEEENKDLLTAYVEELKKINTTSSSDHEIPYKVLRDLALNFMVAGRDTVGATLSWFFWLLAKNPSAEAKIREEIHANLPTKAKDEWGFSSTEELGGLVYLHGAICETLRLYPAVALQHRSAATDDVLPSGHRVRANTRVVLSLYSMGRLKGVWGDDCLEFKPERWISEKGETVHVPSYTSAFSTGPRSCLGNETTFIQMKIVVISIIRRYHVEVVEGQTVVPSHSVLLDLKNGLRVRISRI